jgi:hypothetical protein
MSSPSTGSSTTALFHIDILLGLFLGPVDTGDNFLLNVGFSGLNGVTCQKLDLWVILTWAGVYAIRILPSSRGLWWWMIFKFHNDRKFILNFRPPIYLLTILREWYGTSLYFSECSESVFSFTRWRFDLSHYLCSSWQRERERGLKSGNLRSHIRTSAPSAGLGAHEDFIPLSRFDCLSRRWNSRPDPCTAWRAIAAPLSSSRLCTAWPDMTAWSTVSFLVY